MAHAGVNLLRASRAYDSYYEAWRLPCHFDFAEAKGLHILPVHFYTPIPTKSDLQRKRRPNSLNGLSIDVAKGTAAAIERITEFSADIQRLVAGSRGYRPDAQSFAPLDAAVLYSTIRKFKPRKIIEIGSGMSTIVMLDAIKDGSLDTKVTCVEPYPPDYLKARQQELGAFIEKPLQEVDLSLFDSLEAGDILFIDSTHVVRFDSDVVYEILELLPRVKPGALVHVHDIFLPFDYPQEWLAEHRFFWAEQYMLQSFLSMNPHFEIDIPVYAASEQVLMATRIPVTGALTTSLWMRRI